MAILVGLVILQISSPLELSAEYAKFLPRVGVKVERHVDPKEAEQPWWGWEQACLPDINKTWVGGTSPSPHDPVGLELPISFWSAIPSVRDNGTTIVIVGPQYSTQRHKSAPRMQPESNFHKYEFECHFPSVDVTVPGVIETDPHKNLGIVKCALPPNEPLATGKSTFTTFTFRDLSHRGHTQFTTCVHPTSKISYELAAVIAGRNIGCHLEEWLENLFMQGVDHVFFYDHFNEDTYTHSLLRRYVLQGLVTVMPWRMTRDVLWGGKFDRGQIMLYNDALHRFRAKWLFIGDVDEFPLFTPHTEPEGVAEVSFFNQTKYLDSNAPRPQFQLPSIPKFKSNNMSRAVIRRDLVGYLDYLDAKSNYKLGSIEVRHLLFGTTVGFNNATQPFCLPDGKLKLREQVMRGGILPNAHPLSQIARKYIARTERTQIVSIHMIAKGGPIVVAPMNILRLHHYWRGERGSRPINNMWLDTSAVRWADIIEQRIIDRRNGTLYYLDQN